jgi:hypothetical protein
MIISAYRGFTAAAIKAKANIPAQADMTVVGTTVDCKNISVSMVRNVLNSSSSGVKGVASDSNVNAWSGFGPTVRTAPAGVLVNSAPAAGSLGSFAGYNHYAVAPGWVDVPVSGDVYVASGGSVTFDAHIILGEVNWADMGIIAVMLAVYDGTTLLSWDAVNLEDEAVGSELWISHTRLNQTIQRAYTVKIFLVNHLVDFSENDIVCRLPNTSDYTKTVKILPATTSVFEAPDGFTASVGFTNSPNFGTVYYTNLEGIATYDEVRVYASIWGWREGAIGSEILIDTFAPWHHDDFADGSGQPNGEYFIGANGYICTIRVEAINY